MMIMEDISLKPRLLKYEAQHSDIAEKTIAETNAFQERLIDLFNRSKLIGHLDPIGKHLYVDKIENGEFFYVLIDPNR